MKSTSLVLDWLDADWFEGPAVLSGCLCHRGRRKLACE